MFHCPRCKSKLGHVQGVGSNYWECPTCKGHAMSLPLLRRRADPAALATLWQATQRTGRVLDVECPSCFQRMKEVQFAPKGEVVPIDVCQRCQFLWFDSGELARVPKYTPPPKPEQKARGRL